MYFKEVAQPLSLATSSAYTVETIVSDLFMLYRCYAVWNAYWPVVVFPVLLFVADCFTGIYSIYTMSLAKNNAFDPTLEKTTTSFFTCTLAINALCTGLIAFRVWWTQRLHRNLRVFSSLGRLTVIVIESGAIYFVALIFVVGTHSAKVIEFKIPLDMTSPIIVRAGEFVPCTLQLTKRLHGHPLGRGTQGISFVLIIVRVGQCVSSETTPQASASSLSFAVAAVMRNGARTTVEPDLEEVQHHGGGNRCAG
ncbi:hypothetical protein BV25DRAFT_1822743 [Artomyces pyxidatus]|uniref:Uncharacterized protein n=1 Tax=Artomyces pyxidatus TaxID=48021 RepID=A0ACB8T8Z0_9AGAM|nr:hypothetical protein BV25DRAFT_1822743 [Artomyces pyxidatus]